MLELVEKFITISGEAPIPGHPVYLIRFSKCNLSCIYCDTSNRNEVNYRIENEDLLEDIIQNTGCYPYLKVLFTGGEPLLDYREKSIYSIIEKLKKVDFYIETNGSIKIKKSRPDNCHYVCDWKTPSSGFNESFNIENITCLSEKQDCIKFVVAESDLDWMKETVLFIYKKKPRIPIYISPCTEAVNIIRLVGYILKNKLPVSLSLQIHKMIWSEAGESSIINGTVV